MRARRAGALRREALGRAFRMHLRARACLGADGGVGAAQPPACTQTTRAGVPSECVLGHPLWELFTTGSDPESSCRLRQEAAAAAASGRPFELLGATLAAPGAGQAPAVFDLVFT